MNRHKFNDAISAMMAECKVEYEKLNGYEIDAESRLKHYVQDRVALANAWRPYATYKAIGEALGGFDHSTVVHYAKEHEPMLKAYPSYGKKFNDALDITRDLAKKMGMAPQLKSGSHRHLRQELMIVENTIKNLRQLSRKIQLKLADERGVS